MLLILSGVECSLTSEVDHLCPHLFCHLFLSLSVPCLHPLLFLYEGLLWRKKSQDKGQGGLQLLYSKGHIKRGKLKLHVKACQALLLAHFSITTLFFLH